MRLTKTVHDTIGDTFFILDVDMELLQVGRPLLMVVILQFPQNVMFPLTTGL
jgi:hypothetical protein